MSIADMNRFELNKNLCRSLIKSFMQGVRSFFILGTPVCHDAPCYPYGNHGIASDWQRVGDDIRTCMPSGISEQVSRYIDDLADTRSGARIDKQNLMADRKAIARDIDIASKKSSGIKHKCHADKQS